MSGNRGAAGSPGYDEMTCMIQRRMEGLVRLQQPTSAVPKAKAALQQLLRSRDYTGSGSASGLASYRAELLSFPDEDLGGCPFLADMLSGEDRQLLSEASERFLRKVSQRGEIKDPYWDPKIKFNQKAYHSLVRRLHSLNYFYYSTAPKNFVGVFFVWKSGNTRLRMISDARLANLDFEEPPPVSLLTGEGMGAIEVELEDVDLSDYELLDSLLFWLGLSDVKDCFHRMRVPKWLAEHFAWRPVPAKVVGMTGASVDGKVL